jgi:hypothetical protein
LLAQELWHWPSYGYLIGKRRSGQQPEREPNEVTPELSSV